MNRKAGNKQVGFTLVELLIAITLCAIITVISVTGLRFGLKNFTGNSQKKEQQDNLKQFISMFRHQLQQIHPARIGNVGNEAVAFYGDSKTIKFVSYLSGHRGVSGLYVLKYKFKADSSELFVEYQNWNPSSWHSDRSDHQTKRKLLQGVEKITFRYFHGKQKKWTSSWSDNNSLPALVAINISLINSRDDQLYFISRINAGVEI